MVYLRLAFAPLVPAWWRGSLVVVVTAWEPFLSLGGTVHGTT